MPDYFSTNHYFSKSAKMSIAKADKGKFKEDYYQVWLYLPP